MFKRFSAALDGRIISRCLILAVAYYATARFGIAMPYVGSRITLVWLPTGIAVAALYRWDRAYWPAIFLAAVLVNAGIGSSWLSALGIGVGNTLGPTMAAWGLARFGFHPAFDRQRDIVTFCAAAALAMLLPATGGVTTLVVTGEIPLSGAVHAWATWWVGDTMGVLLVGPLLVSIRQGAVRALLNKHVEFLVWCVAAAAISIGVLINAGPTTVAPPALFLPLLLILWTAVRFGVAVTSFCALGVAMLAAWGVATGHGPFQNSDVQAGLRMLWAYLAILTVVGLMVAALLAERARAESAVREGETRYQSLFESNPQPMWVYDRETMCILAVNDAAVAHYGYTRDEFLAMSIMDIRPPEDIPALRQERLTRVGSATITRGWRHRLKNGQLIDVEISRHSLEYAGRPAEVVLASDVTERVHLERALLDAADREQRRLSHELHDGLGQEITGFAMLAQALASAEKQGHPTSASDLERLSGWASRAVGTCRTIARGLSPVGDVYGGLIQALRDLAGLHAGSEIPTVRFDVIVSAPLRLESEATDHLYRVAQEGLTNALRHASARTINILLEVLPSVVRLQILDDGCGIPTTTFENLGLGLEIMRYRASVVGACLSVARREGGGTLLLCEFPQPATGRQQESANISPVVETAASTSVGAGRSA